MSILKKVSFALCFLVGILIYLSSIPLANAHEQNTLTVCAVPQMYSALHIVKNNTKFNLKLKIDTATDLYAEISNTKDLVCDVLLSTDERLPITLIRSTKALDNSLTPFAYTPLVLWSKDPNLLKGKNIEQVFNQQILQNIALAKTALTPVGLATHQLLQKSSIKTEYLKPNIYRADHEYKVYSMIDSGNVQCGFISKPLIANINNQIKGSYIEIPRNYHADIIAYAVVFKDSQQKEQAKKFIQSLMSDKKSKIILQNLGFMPLPISSL